MGMGSTIIFGQGILCEKQALSPTLSKTYRHVALRRRQIRLPKKNYLAIHIIIENGVLCDFPALPRTAKSQ